MKCSECNNKIQETFLNKPIGTAVKEQGKIKWICNNCQKNQK